MALVVKSWKVTSHPAAGEPSVSIVARDSGLLSFVLSILGIDATATLQVSSRHVFYEEGSLAGFRRCFIPLEHVAYTFYGRIKPWKATGVYIAVSIGLGGTVGGAAGMLLAIVGVALSCLYYFLNRTLTIGVVDVSGGPPTSLSFNRSLIEGQEIDEKAAENVIRVIEHLIKPTEGAALDDMSLGSTSGSGAMARTAPQTLGDLGRNLGLGGSRASLAPTTAASAAGAMPAKAIGCPKCAAAISPDELFCGSCGHKLR
jgi:hypothetical protein